MGPTLKSLREARGESHETIARVAAVKSASGVKKWETGERHPGLYQAILLAEHFHVTVEQLCGRVPLGGRQRVQVEFDQSDIRTALEDTAAANLNVAKKIETALKALDALRR